MQTQTVTQKILNLLRKSGKNPIALLIIGAAIVAVAATSFIVVKVAEKGARQANAGNIVGPLFEANFTTTPDGIITNEYPLWNNGAGKVSPDWEMTSGSLFARGGNGWTGEVGPKGTPVCAPNITSSNCTNSEIFRLNTKQTFKGNIKVTADFKQNKEIHNAQCSTNDTCWHGVHIWMRYQTQYNLYYASINRADGKVGLKRKVPCGSDNKGTYFELAQYVPHDWKVGEWNRYSVSVQDNTDGSVTLKLYDLKAADPTRPVVTGTDKGGTNYKWTAGCATPGKYATASYTPLRDSGKVGIRGDYANFYFNNFKVEALTAAAIPGVSSYDTTVLADSPVAYWPLKAAGATENDATGRNHTVSYKGSAPALTTLPNGERAPVFNGTDQYAEVADASDLSVPQTGQLTVEAWMRPDTLSFARTEGSGYVHWMGKGVPGQHEYVSRMYSQGNTEGRANRISGYAFSLAGGQGAGSYFEDPVKAGEWIHYALVINTKNTSSTYPTGYTKIYKNGQLRDQDSLKDYNIIAADGTAPFRIGTRSLDSFFKGAIGKVAVYGSELTADQLKKHYAAMSVVTAPVESPTPSPEPTPIPAADATSPTISLTSPINGASLSGSKEITATASDNVSVAKVDFYAGTTLLATDATSPYSIIWNTMAVANGSYPISVKAYDAAGNMKSASITVTVANPVSTAPAPATPATYPSGTSGVKVQEDVYSQWESGYCKKFVLTNTTSSPITWEIKALAAGQITSTWGMSKNYIRTGDVLTLRGETWNKTLKSGEVRTDVGLCAKTQ